MIENILSIDEVLKKGNLPDDPDETLEETSDDDIYKLVNRFYNERGDVNPEEFVIESEDGEKSVVKTTLGRPIDDSLKVEEINPMNLHHSHFSSKGLKKAGIDRENSWNGEKAGMLYRNGSLNILKSDYYTVKTFAYLPYIEAAKAVRDHNEVDEVPLDELSLRNKYLKNKDDFHRTKWMCSGGSVGGAIIANSGDSWKLILGKRSDKTSINSDRVSIAPNGAMEYDHLCEEGFQKDLRLNFNEELFRGRKQPNFFEDYVDPYMISSGWNLRSGELAIGYALIVRDPDGYDKLINRKNHNFEFSELVEIDVNDPKEIVDKVNLEDASPSVIPTVYRSLALFESITDESHLDYTIERN